MERTPQRWLPRTIVLSAGLAFFVTQVGCVGLLSNLLYDNRMVPARYEELAEQKVAVVCVSGDSIYTPHSTATDLAARVEQLLKKNVKDIEVIDQNKVADWIDNNDWDLIDYDYRKIARGVGADKLVAIELDSFSMREGGTMYKGKCDVNVSVYDMTTDGEETLILDAFPIKYPTNGAVSTAARTERQFRSQFLKVIAHDVAKSFYRHDLREDMALDSTLVGR